MKNMKTNEIILSLLPKKPQNMQDSTLRTYNKAVGEYCQSTNPQYRTTNESRARRTRQRSNHVNF